MAKTKAESERDGKVNLSDLTNIPAKEFEKHFRDWMERDDVARSLQAKLRTDLIANFNKTALGKHILAQTTTTTGGGITQRLTLCPLTLALNTLVAEFLYAENCHFTLSVFCTEVPFRNTLPDFESMRQFRFNEQEISEVVIAVAGDLVKTEKRLIADITHKYLVDGGVGGSGSLLLFIIKVLLERMHKAEHTKIPPTTESKPTETLKPPTGDSKEAQHEFKTEVYNSNFRYLNKYLIILSKKVNEMTQQFKSLQQRNGRSSVRPRILKTTQTRKFENLNRSLDRITENLKQMSHAKRRSKHVGAIVSAIEGLAQQFTKCATNFENVSRGLSGRQGGVGVGVGAAASRVKMSSRVTSAEKQTETETETARAGPGPGAEKSYMDWVQEMRHTSNGQKFLDRIELALRKALNKQREQLNNETDMKLRHQKELLKIRYKQKLMEELTKHGSNEHSLETRKINENIERKLQQFEQKHFELLHKIHETEAEVKKLPHKTVLQVEKLIKEPKVVNAVPTTIGTATAATTTTSASASASMTAAVTETVPATTPKKSATKPTKPILKDAVNTQKQLQQIVDNMTQQERAVDHIVYDAKLRIQELENESNQLEQSFLNYLARQRMEKEATNKAAAKLWDYYATERDKMWQRFKGGGRGNCNVGNKNSTCIQNSKDEEAEEDEGDDDLLHERKQLKQLHMLRDDLPTLTRKEELTSGHVVSTADDVQCRNAMLEAKETFFENKRRCMEHVERQFEFISLPNDVEEFANTEIIKMQQQQQSIQSNQSIQSIPAATKDYQRFLQQTKTKSTVQLKTIKETAVESKKSKSQHECQSQAAEMQHANAQSNTNVQQNKQNKSALKVVKLPPENNTKPKPTTTAKATTKTKAATTTTAPIAKTTTTTTTKHLLDNKVMAFDEDFTATAASTTTTTTTLTTTTSISTSSKTSTVLKQSMAKMQMLFNDTPGKSEDIKKEQNLPAISSLKHQTSTLALEPIENRDGAANTALQGIANMLNTTMTESGTPSITSANTTTESTSTEQQLQSMLEVNRLPVGKVIVPELTNLAMSSDGSIDQIESINTNDSASGGATSIEVAALLHAHPKHDEKASGEELGEVPDDNEKLTGTTTESQEIGEVPENKSNQMSAFTPLTTKVTATTLEQKVQATSSDESSIELQLSLGSQRKANGSDSDFWA